MNPAWEVILVGGGLANGLLAWRLKQCQPQLRLLLIEAASAPGEDHTWSFHHQDISAVQHAWLAPLVAQRWSGYQVRFPAFTRQLNSAYYSISAAQFARQLAAVMGDDLWLNCAVERLSPDSVTLAQGGTLQARTVIDGRGWQRQAALHLGFQAFVGQQWQLAQPHGLTQPIIMDATVDQSDGYRFVYTLPLSERVLLIEDTHYIGQASLSSARARSNIAAYAAAQGWTLSQLEREEQGMLPITLGGDHHAFWQALAQQPCSGLRAGLFHATTGYSLPQAVALADLLAQQTRWEAGAVASLIHQFATQQWQQQRFFRLLNRMLFLAGRPEQRWQVMQRFYRLNEGLIARFYAGQLRQGDKARILFGKPPVPPGEALKAIFTPTYPTQAS